MSDMPLYAGLEVRALLPCLSIAWSFRQRGFSKHYLAED